MPVISLTNPAHPGHRTQAISTKGRIAERIWNPESPLDMELENILIGVCQSHLKELCGFITADEDYIRIDNIHLEPYHNFYMNPDQVEEVIKKIYSIRNTFITGIWHTHPNNVPWPSARDLVGWPNPDLRWRYWIVTNKEVIEWRLCDDPPVAV